MQALSALEIPLLSKFLIGESITRGNGAGADPEKGLLSAVESAKQEVKKQELNQKKNKKQRLKVQNLYRIY